VSSFRRVVAPAQTTPATPIETSRCRFLDLRNLTTAVTMPEYPIPQHRGSLMPTAHDHRGHTLRRGDDGWRTPTIEDAHHPANLYSDHDPDDFDLNRHFETCHHRHSRSHRLHSASEEMRDPPSNDSSINSQPKCLPWRQRLKHVTWAWFTLTMATGGIANVICGGTSFESALS
jgi:hypothetical protein